MAKLISVYNFAFLVIIGTYFYISKILFDRIFNTSNLIIDEEFHLPQGLLYCNFTFDTWNPKITTLPGLYLITALVLGPVNLCTVYWLRFINVAGSVVNLILFNIYLNMLNPKMRWLNLLSSFNLAILPPLYFFSHLYYTDIFSVTFILLLNICSKSNNHLWASFFGVLSILMRQTNIVWVGFSFGVYFLKTLLSLSKGDKYKYKNMDKDVAWNEIIEVGRSCILYNIWRKSTFIFWTNVTAYLSVILSFLLFIYINGGIVVGDKTAHKVSLHLPQIFYFSTFCLIFAWPFFISSNNVMCFLSNIRKSRVLVFVSFLLFALIIYYNTLEHPYLLADNRHYTFYVWNRLYRRYSWIRYIMIPVYYFGLYGLINNLSLKCNAIFSTFYIISMFATLVLQQMIEVRYFLIPFIYYRFHIKKIQFWQVLLEFITSIVINAAVFYIFFTKDIFWPDFEYVQKLIW
ncbi:hypothetical protein FQA39_LY01339 [Lamprigera yunnana]|nr:hypothetical protein FQA39_LY01339 [Lamprigera yunnana]